MNCKVKGNRAERRCIRILEAAGYVCTKVGGSLGVFDVIAIGPSNVRCVQVMSGGEYLSGLERQQISQVRAPANVTREAWALSVSMS